MSGIYTRTKYDDCETSDYIARTGEATNYAHEPKAVLNPAFATNNITFNGGVASVYDMGHAHADLSKRVDIESYLKNITDRSQCIKTDAPFMENQLKTVNPYKYSRDIFPTNLEP
jgi:hypothetical protein